MSPRLARRGAIRPIHRLGNRDHPHRRAPVDLVTSEAGSSVAVCWAEISRQGDIGGSWMN
jgi:hypothetical protein